MKYVSRAGWGARKPRSRLLMSRSNGLGGHYNGPAILLPAGCGSACHAAVRATQRFHMDGRGWADIAYNWLICPHGTIFEGRGWGVRSAANGTNAGNSWGFAVMVLIGQGQPFPDAAKRAFNEVRLEHQRRYGTTGLRDHSSFKATECAGNPIRAWIAMGAPVPGAIPNPIALPEEEDLMIILKRTDNNSQWLIAGNSRIHIPTVPLLRALEARLGKSIDAPPEFVNAFEYRNWKP